MSYNLVIQRDLDRRDTFVHEEPDLLRAQNQSEKQGGKLAHEVDAAFLVLPGAGQSDLKIGDRGFNQWPDGGVKTKTINIFCRRLGGITSDIAM